MILINKILRKKVEDVDKKIPSTSDLVKKTDYNTRIIETENKIPNITGLYTDCNTKITDI